MSATGLQSEHNAVFRWALWGLPVLFLGVSLCVGRYSLSPWEILAALGLHPAEVKDVVRTVELNIRLSLIHI